jgi:hypothetical protein
VKIIKGELITKFSRDNNDLNVAKEVNSLLQSCKDNNDRINLYLKIPMGIRKSQKKFEITQYRSLTRLLKNQAFYLSNNTTSVFITLGYVLSEVLKGALLYLKTSGEVEIGKNILLTFRQIIFL